MSNKTIKTRIQQKHDYEANWIKAGDNGFIPLDGEVIIYDAETDSEGNILSDVVLPQNRTTPYSYTRIKVGDGVTVINDLPFSSSESGVYVGSGDMPEGYNIQIDVEGDVYKLPTKVSQLENDAGYITADDVPDTGLVFVKDNKGDTLFGGTSIAYGNGVYVAVNDSEVAYSYDGLGWTVLDLSAEIAEKCGFDNTYTWRCVAYGEGVFIASAHVLNLEVDLEATYGYGADYSLYARSADGKVWELISLVQHNYYDEYDSDKELLITDGKLICLTVAPGDVAGYSALKYTDIHSNLTQWKNDNNLMNPNQPDEPLALYSIAEKDGVYVVTTSQGIYRSTDLDNWTQVASNESDHDCIVATDVGFVLCSGAVACGALFSSDGINWEKVADCADGYTSDLCSAIYGNGYCLALFEEGYITRYSSDGSCDNVNPHAWIRINSSNDGAVHGWRDLVYSGNQFVAISTEGVSATSSDGITWHLATEVDIETIENAKFEQNGEDITDKVIDLVTKDITVPTKTSELENDAGYITADDVPDVDVSVAINEHNADPSAHEDIRSELFITTTLPEAPHGGTLICTDTAYMLYDNVSDKVSVFKKGSGTWETYHNSLGIDGLVPVYGKGDRYYEGTANHDYFIAISNFTSYYSYDGINFTELTSVFDNLADYKALGCYYDDLYYGWNIMYNKDGRNYINGSSTAADEADWTLYELPGGQTQIDETWKFRGYCGSYYGDRFYYYTNSENTDSAFVLTNNGAGDDYYVSPVLIGSPICKGDNVSIAWTKKNSAYILIYTENGEIWNETSFDTVDDASIFCYNNGTFVWSQPNKDVSIKYSTDGINWADSSLGMALTSISANGNGFVGIRDGVCYRSTDGINWSSELSEPLKQEVIKHISNTNNPHEVTADQVLEDVELPQEWFDINEQYDAIKEYDHKLKGGVIYKDFEGNTQVFPLAPPYGIRTDEVDEKYAQSTIAMYNSKQQLMVKPGTDGRHTVSLRQLDQLFGGGNSSDLAKGEKSFSITTIPPVNKNDPKPYVFGRDASNTFSAKNYNEAAVANNLVDRDAQGRTKVAAPDVNSTTPDSKHVVNVDYANRKYLAKTGGTITGNLELKTTSNPSVKLTDSSDGNSAAYVQAYKGKAHMGYGAAKSISVDKSGNVNVPGNLTVSGSVSCGEPKKDTDAVTLKTLNEKLANVDINGKALTFEYSANYNQLGCEKLAYGDGLYVGVGKIDSSSNISQIIYSIDGVNWTNYADSNWSFDSWAGIAYGNGKFVAVDKGDRGWSKVAIIENIEDNATRTITEVLLEPEALAGFSFVANDIEFINGKFIIVGRGLRDTGDFVACHFLTSEDGIEWTADYFIHGDAFIPDHLYPTSIAYNNDTYVITTAVYGDFTGKYFFMGTDLNSLSFYDWPFNDTPEIVIPITDGFFACDSNYYDAWFSRDGLNWTYLGYAHKGGCVAAACGNGKIITLSADGTAYIYDENDLQETYEHRVGVKLLAESESNNWSDIIFANNEFIAVSTDDHVLHSGDGIYWTLYSGKFVQEDKNVTSDVIDFLSNNFTSKAQYDYFFARGGDINGELRISDDGIPFRIETTDRSDSLIEYMSKGIVSGYIGVNNNGPIFRKDKLGGDVYSILHSGNIAENATIKALEERIAELEAKLAAMTTEPWTFTTEEGAVVNKDVYVVKYSEGLIYSLNADGATYSVTGIGECTDTSIVIPRIHMGLPVTSIGTYAFYECSSLTSITIPDSVTSIGFGAFADCSSLMSITFKGTKEQWNAITKDLNWNDSTGNYTVYCTDGNIAKV